MSLPQGFDFPIGENGTSLSGGEKQKIAIARALLKIPLLIIFDEATSNLDVFSEKQIVQIIKELHNQGLTIITIAHRLSTIHNCDRIIVLDDGKIIEEGTHEELIAGHGMYSKMLIWLYFRGSHNQFKNFILSIKCVNIFIEKDKKAKSGSFVF